MTPENDQKMIDNAQPENLTKSIDQSKIVNTNINTAQNTDNIYGEQNYTYENQTYNMNGSNVSYQNQETSNNYNVNANYNNSQNTNALEAGLSIF